MEYTKGKWELKSQEIYSGREIIASVSQNNDNFKSNANLISASPDMYEALKALVNQEDWYNEEVPPESPIGKAYRALAKAEGR